MLTLTQIITLTLIAPIYLALGIDYLEVLKNHCSAFRKATDEHPLLYPIALFAWPAIFVIHITWCCIEPLTRSRRKDWQ